MAGGTSDEQDFFLSGVRESCRGSQGVPTNNDARESGDP
ncbi:hypothetical protein RISK_002097 [Rhodopirellula islandica]|uniref:Uncharacterized protein n=1 Tax=Rhodopirellula islandica TaxID=595434 RepID=A0A0J1BFZ5_RHOIS|nr:hypothetical protein RISK_002097 [Rhodopirellula islandica]